MTSIESFTAEPPLQVEHGALAVWNPLFEPHTIAVHVNHLRASGQRQSRRTWWGRIYDSSRKHPPEEMCRALDQALDACRRTIERRGRAVLFVTDFRQLHAMEIDEVRRTLDDVDEAPPVQERPSHYQGHSVLAWFGVRDIRALSFEPFDTLQYLREHLFVYGGQLGFDPYASLGLRYPLFVRGPSAEELFERPRQAEGIECFADQAETLYAPRIANARRKLEGMIGSGTWERLEEPTRTLLANGYVLLEQYQAVPGDLELTPVVMCLCTALERELVGEILQPLLSALEQEQSALAQRDLLRQAWERCELKRAVTLGACPILIPRLKSWPPLQQCCALNSLASTWGQWLSDVVKHRNNAAHARRVDARWANEAARLLFGQDRNSPLGCPFHTLTEAKQEVRQLLNPS